jgi:dihydrofolate synthase / folylpolyglutamate synthase
MDYNETLQFLFSRLPAWHRIGKAAYKADLQTSEALDQYFGKPHRNYTTIHVAGTNGKGSVSHMLASILQEAGYRTGLYTSPHLKDFRERIRVNGEMIGEEAVIEFVEKHKEILLKLEPSFFEMTVAMAFDHFAASKVDAAIVEVGLGGRLDSTNIITPVLSVITNIGHDHMDLLGDTPSMIAAEKAGIIKDSVPVVISQTQPEVKDVFVTKAAACGSAISFADELFRCRLKESYDVKGGRKYLITDLSSLESQQGLSVLSGDYQEFNIQAVYCAVKSLQPHFDVSQMNISAGIANVIRNTGLAGRWQILNNEPLTICDTAHNREGLELVMIQLEKIPRTALHIIIGFVNDKDLNLVLPLFPRNATYYFTRASIPRALDENLLRTEAARFGLTGSSYPDVASALAAANEKAAAKDIIFIGGSTFVVAEVV